MDEIIRSIADNGFFFALFVFGIVILCIGLLGKIKDIIDLSLTRQFLLVGFGAVVMIVSLVGYIYSASHSNIANVPTTWVEAVSTHVVTPTIHIEIANTQPTINTIPTETEPSTSTDILPTTSTSTTIPLPPTDTPVPPTQTTTPIPPSPTPAPSTPTPTFTPVPATTVPTVQVIVDARGGWQNTNVEISTNDVLTIQYVGGDWTGNANNPGKSRGENAPWAERTEECLPVKGQDSSLVSRIGGGKSFVVGQYFSDRILSSGKLELRMNDCDQWLGDNDGAITVSILVNR